jgi:hypothetical protein
MNKNVEPSHQEKVNSSSSSSKSSTDDQRKTPSTEENSGFSWWTKLLPKGRLRSVFGAGAVLLLSGGSIAVQFLPPTAGSSQMATQQQNVSLADYERLKVGMSLTDAQATLGRAIEISRDETTATYKWVNGDGSEITAVFNDDRLVSKKQSGFQ